MNFSNISTTVRELATILPLLGGVTLFVAVLLVIYRTGSDHAIRKRIWRLVHGKEDVSDGDIRRFIGEQSDLMAFRFESNLRVRTIEQARRLTNWLKDCDEDISAVRRCRRYFDLEKCRLERPLPGKATTVAWVAVMTVFAIPAALLPYAVVDHKVLLKINESGTWFLVSPDVDRASPWPPKLFSKPSEPLLIEACRSEAGTVPTSTPFSAADTEVICDLLESSDSPTYLSTALVQQRIGATVLLVLLAVLAYLPFRELTTIQAARQMSERLEGRRMQSEFDFGL